MGADATLFGELLAAGLADNTWTSYAKKFRQFAAFCTARDMVALPATTKTVFAWVTQVYRENKIHDVTAYLSAINTIDPQAARVPTTRRRRPAGAAVKGVQAPRRQTSTPAAATARLTARPHQAVARMLLGGSPWGCRPRWCSSVPRPRVSTPTRPGDRRADLRDVVPAARSVRVRHGARRRRRPTLPPDYYGARVENGGRRHRRRRLRSRPPAHAGLGGPPGDAARVRHQLRPGGADAWHQPDAASLPSAG